jgi:mono/diheme cytochrome c family protein
MNKKLINVVLHTVFAAAIIMAFLPFLKSSDDGYHGAKPIVPEKAAEMDRSVEPVMAESETVATATDTVVSTEPAEPEAVEATTEPVVDDVAKVNDAAVESTPTAPSTSLENEDESALYSVVDGNKLDANSYAGFKLFRNWCARCHGTYGQGMVGPNLADSLKVISEKQFFDTVENGKSGQIGSMPAWRTNTKVMEGRDQLYAYLKARSDGAIGEVKPKKQ